MREEQKGNQDSEEQKNKEEESEEEKEEDSNKGSASDDEEEDKKEEDKKEEETKEFGHNAGDQSAPTEQGWDSKEEPVAETDTSWESQKGNLLDKSVRENQYFNLHEFKNYKEFVVDYKQVLKDFRKYHNKFFYGTDDKGKRWENKDRIIKMFDKRFFRMWEFYLLASKYSFLNMGNVVFQIQIAKNVNNVPLTRNYIYN